MAGSDVSSNANRDAEPATARSNSARYGHLLFGLYSLLYAGYVLLTAFAPEVLERKPFAGINLSVLYGLGLIVTAFVLAVFYDLLCRFLERDHSSSAREVRQ
jgi:uncharacterized membrane protein (DUF485 family)